jgi:very-short-patch-repair endonuclease
MTRSARLDHAALTDLLVRQYQVISRNQAMARGMTADVLRHRIRAGGPWQRLLPGVFLAVTGTPTTDQRNVAALLYAGSGGLMTGAAALRRWGVQAPHTTVIDVLIPVTRQRRSTGFVRIHPTTRMPEQVFTAGPVKLVPLARAVADTARGLTKLADVRALVAAVVQQGRCTSDLLAAELQDGPVQGSALLRMAVDDVRDGTRSNPEADLKDLVRNARLPPPVFNPKLYLGDEFIASPDAWWQHVGVALEVDSREYHLSPQDHERTLERHARMAACGITVLHFTPRQLRAQPAKVIATIKSALDAAQNRPPLPIRADPATS